MKFEILSPKNFNRQYSLQMESGPLTPIFILNSDSCTWRFSCSLVLSFILADWYEILTYHIWQHWVYHTYSLFQSDAHSLCLCIIMWLSRHCWRLRKLPTAFKHLNKLLFGNILSSRSDFHHRNAQFLSLAFTDDILQMSLWFVSLQLNATLILLCEPGVTHPAAKVLTLPIPRFHTPAPLRKKYMYLRYLYPSVNGWNEFCTSTIKNCQKAKIFFKVGVSGALMCLQMSPQIS